MRVTRPLVSAAAALVLVGAFAACGSSEATIGPVTVVPPKGWLVTDREATSLKVTNGTIADPTSTAAGGATAVFDIFVSSEQTLEGFREVLRDNNVAAEEQRIEIDGYEAVIVSYRSGAFGPSAEVVFVPAWDVRIVYRAAFGDAEAAFVRHRDEFRSALGSMTFTGRRPGRA